MVDVSSGLVGKDLLFHHGRHLPSANFDFCLGDGEAGRQGGESEGPVSSPPLSFFLPQPSVYLSLSSQ